MECAVTHQDNSTQLLKQPIYVLITTYRIVGYTTNQQVAMKWKLEDPSNRIFEEILPYKPKETNT